MADENKPAFYPRVGNIKAKNFKPAKAKPFVDDERAMDLPQFGDFDLSVPSKSNLEMARRIAQRDADLKRQQDADTSPLEKLAGGLQAGRFLGSALTQAAASIPTAITKGGKAAEEYIAQNIYKPNQPKALEYAGDVGDFLEKLETQYKIPPVLPEAVALQYLTAPATSQAMRTAGKGAQALERSLDPMVTQALERGGLQRDLLLGLGQGTASNLDVWHGSPHKFPPTAKNPLGEFNATKIGTGEGAQAYGHGHYTSEAKEVGKGYQPRSPEYEEKLIKLYNKAQSSNNYPMMEVLEDAMLHSDPEDILKKFTNPEFEYTSDHAKAAQDFANWYAKNPPEVGSLYRVDLADAIIPKMLDWNAKFENQHPDVQSAILKYWADNPSMRHYGDPTKMTGEGIYGSAKAASLGPEGESKVNLNPSNEAASMDLRHYGIPGIKYLDESHRTSNNIPAGVTNFVVFPGEENALTILERKKEGGSVAISNNPDTMMFEVNNQKLAGGGLAKLLRAAPKSAEEIKAIAERMAPQMLGEFVRGDKGTQSVAGKTQKQFAKEKEMVHDIRPTGAERPLLKPVDIEQLKGNVVIGIPGDPTIAGQTVHSIGGIPLESPSPQHGGPLYGLGRDDAFWASGLGAANRVQNLAREAGMQYDAPVLGKYIMMGPESINYAQHFADANLAAIDPSKMTKGQIESFNNLVREGYPYKKKGEDFTRQRVFPAFPGIENPSEAYLHFSIDPELRKHFNALMQMPTVTEKHGLPSGIDVRHAITEPDLRDLETGVTGKSIGRMKPEVTKLGLSEHPTYSHDIPGEFLGSSKYPIPYELSFPDTVRAIRENPKQAPHEFGSLKMVGPRQIIDQQMIDEIKQYEEQIKRLTGKKKGGTVHKAAGGEITGDDLIIEERPL